MAYHLDPSREDGGGIDGAAVVARAMGSDAESVERLARAMTCILSMKTSVSSDYP